ncbi:hypothetical protein FNV62_06425 [Streptomyces sp. RLB3-17]|uniref:hypothetical protein n=1 Tax=unclassified Streptomyces TaxID=2593676 RepID=UPI0011641284|nr:MULTISPECIES: hypothetical protein [unclassified Streptomyces]QDN85521.1 hypothetical protein FNV61_07600 [Streptomyces sp. RLB3-6]QDO37867.1 hypothetical protein FNV62_06425 [Streptomyces sp. RLB3-17]
MALFRRRTSDGPDWITDLPGKSRTTRKFFQALVQEYLYWIQRSQGVTITSAPAGTWGQVDWLALAHKGCMNRVGRTIRGVNILAPEIQDAIRIATDQFAAHHGVRGSLVRVWAFAKPLNERFASGWQRSELFRIAWWEERPVAFACILHPAKEGEPLIDGVLIFDHVTYEFTPDAESQPQVVWHRRQVRDAEEPHLGATVLHLNRSTGYSRADIASSIPVILETQAGPLFTAHSRHTPRGRQRRDWGSVG